MRALTFSGTVRKLLVPSLLLAVIVVVSCSDASNLVTPRKVTDVDTLDRLRPQPVEYGNVESQLSEVVQSIRGNPANRTPAFSVANFSVRVDTSVRPLRAWISATLSQRTDQIRSDSVTTDTVYMSRLSFRLDSIALPFNGRAAANSNPVVLGSSEIEIAGVPGARGQIVRDFLNVVVSIDPGFRSVSCLIDGSASLTSGSHTVVVSGRLNATRP